MVQIRYKTPTEIVTNPSKKNLPEKCIFTENDVNKQRFTNLMEAQIPKMEIKDLNLMKVENPVHVELLCYIKRDTQNCDQKKRYKSPVAFPPRERWASYFLWIQNVVNWTTLSPTFTQ